MARPTHPPGCRRADEGTDHRSLTTDHVLLLSGQLDDDLPRASAALQQRVRFGQAVEGEDGADDGSQHPLGDKSLESGEARLQLGGEVWHQREVEAGQGAAR